MLVLSPRSLSSAGAPAAQVPGISLTPQTSAASAFTCQLSRRNSVCRQESAVFTETRRPLEPLHVTCHPLDDYLRTER